MGQGITVRLIAEEEMEEVRQQQAICFNFPYEKKEKTEEEKQPEGDSQVMKRKDRWYGAFTADGKLMAAMVAIPYSFYFEGRDFPGYGIGGVCTYPHYRKRGAVRAMFGKMLRDAYDEGRLVSYLYPFSEAFYGRFGYCRMNNSNKYVFDLRGIPDKDWAGKFELYQEGQEDILSACKEVYGTFAVRFGLMVKREAQEDWDTLKEAKAWQNNNYLYLYRDKEGNPSGYIVFKREGENLTCKEFVFRDYESLWDMLAFMKGYASDYRKICFYAPSVLRLESMCRDFAVYPCKIERAMNGMARVINVREALMQAVYRGSGEIVIQVTDPQLVENNGIFRVTFEEGRATSVCFQEADENSRELIHVSMDIAAFSAAIMGDYDGTDLDYMAGVKVQDPEVCGQVFYRKPSFINNSF